MQIKSDRKLFEEWAQLGAAISSLGAIVQNDITAERAQFAEWKQSVAQLEQRLYQLRMRTILDARTRLTESAPHDA